MYEQLENKEWKYEKLAVVVRSPQIKKNMVISPCFAVEQKEMCKDL